MIRGLIKNYPNYIVGYSDHTLPNESMTSLITAYLLGAVIIEKHFTFDKTLPGNDHYHAMDLDDLLRLIDLFNLIQVSLGDKMNKSPIDTENTSRLHARRSIVLNRNVSSGHILRDNDLTYKRPGSGISPLHWDKVIGMRTINNLETDHILKWSDISEKEVK